MFNEKGLPAFDVKKEGILLCRVQLSVPGEHNILNALAAFACCHSLGIPTGVIKETLEAYHGTQRRFDIVGTTAVSYTHLDVYKRQVLPHSILLNVAFRVGLYPLVLRIKVLSSGTRIVDRR